MYVLAPWRQLGCGQQVLSTSVKLCFFGQSQAGRGKGCAWRAGRPPLLAW